ncbi:GNAT family N-acetyltransferase [Flavobacterium sp.]
MIKTNNYSINSLNETDSSQLYQFMIDNKDRLKYYFPVTLASNSSLEKTKEYIVLKEKENQQKSNFTYAIREKNTQNIAGLIIIKKINWRAKQAELAYCIGTPHQGKGAVSFAVSQMINFVFDVLNLKTIQIIAYKDNLPSIKVALNNNFIWKRTLVNQFTPTNKAPLDMELYELTKDKKTATL